MPEPIISFKRTEKKYLMSAAEYRSLIGRIGKYLVPDEYGKSTICSAYLDTPDHRIVRSSIEARNYKEKLRLRSYGVPNSESRVFLEIKKKFDGVVYKRREAMTLSEATKYIRTGHKPRDSQIMRELDYAMRFWGQPQPAVILSYEREAFFADGQPDLRLTFDTGVRYRADRLSLSEGNDGRLLLPHGSVLLEVKSGGGMPLWLADALDSERIFPSSFSKYGTAYRDIYISGMSEINKGENIYA